MKKYDIWDVLNNVQETRNINKDEVIEFANIERVVNTGTTKEIKTLEKAINFLEAFGYSVEEI